MRDDTARQVAETAAVAVLILAAVDDLAAAVDDLSEALDDLLALNLNPNEQDPTT